MLLRGILPLTETVQEIEKSPIVSNDVKSRIDVRVNEPATARGICALEPIDGLIGVAEPGITEGDVVGDDGILSTLASHLIDQRQRLRASRGAGVRMGESAQGSRRSMRFVNGDLEIGDGVRVITFEVIRLAEALSNEKVVLELQCFLQRGITGI